MLSFAGEKMHKSSATTSRSQTRSTRGGERRCSLFFLTGHWRKPLDYSDAALESAAARAEGFREVFRNACEPAPADAWERFAAALDDDFNTPAALAVMHEWRDHDLLRRALGIFGLESLAESDEAPEDVVALAVQRLTTRAARRLRGGRSPARRDRARPAGTCATRPTRSVSSVAGDADTRVRLRAERGARALPRAAAGPRDWVTERAALQIPWLDAGPRPQVKPERVLSEAAGTRDHQGVVAWCEPFRYADAYELAKAGSPLLVCLDQVTDPHNLGAVVRSAEGVGATGVVVPAHGSVRVTPAVCRASAGAVEHLPVAVVPNLARYLADIKGERAVGVRRRLPRARCRCGTRTSRAASRSSSGRKERACGRSSGARATRPSRYRSPARSAR